MTINEKSWHCKVWRLTYGKNNPPQATNLCAYIQRLFWLGIIGQVILMPLRLGFLAILAIFGFRPHEKIKDCIIGNTRYALVDTDTRYRAWTFSGYDDGTPIGLAVWSLILACAGLLLIVLGIQGALKHTWSTYLLFGSTGLLLLCGLITWMQEKLEENETVQLILDYLKAKKDKACPIITFKD